MLLTILSFWDLAARTEWISSVFLPTPMAAAEALREGLMEGDLARFTVRTIEHMAYGWALASLAGITAGALIGMSPTARVWLAPTLEFLRPLPASCVLPVAISILGLSRGTVLLAIAFGAIWPVLLATVHGFSSVEPRLVEVSKVLRISKSAFTFKIGLPNALPDIFAGMRLSLTVSLILAVVGEMVASQEGLGAAILLAARAFRSSELFAGVALLGAIGYLTNKLLGVVERRVLAWR